MGRKRLYEERPKKVFNSFKPEDRITLKLENGGYFEIQIQANEVRVFKIEYFLNGERIKPENYKGKTKAYERWAQIKCSLIENSPGFKGLTPEGSEPNE